jgi:predicted nucleotidyltransferase
VSGVPRRWRVRFPSASATSIDAGWGAAWALPARGEERPDSDIDLLVDFDEDSSLFDLIRMSRELEALLGRAVDVVSAGGLKTRDRAILAESVDL